MRININKNKIYKVIILALQDLLKVSKGVLWVLFIFNTIMDIELH